jgi:DNA-binding XRE family transcriptional regulator
MLAFTMVYLMATPLPVKRALEKLGQDMKDARRKRRIPTQLMAERASMSRATLNKIEKGDPNVAILNYVKVLFVLGMLERIHDLADVRFDRVGQHLDEESLPKRIHLPKRQDWGSD